MSFILTKIAKLINLEKGKKYIIFNYIIVNAFKDNNLLFNKRIKSI